MRRRTNKQERRIRKWWTKRKEWWAGGGGPTRGTTLKSKKGEGFNGKNLKTKKRYGHPREQKANKTFRAFETLSLDGKTKKEREEGGGMTIHFLCPARDPQRCT